MKNSDMPATPIFSSNGVIKSFTDDEGYSSMATGLTKREAFAMAAMQGIMSNAFGDYVGQSWADDMTSDSVKAADALLKELDK